MAKVKVLNLNFIPVVNVDTVINNLYTGLIDNEDILKSISNKQLHVVDKNDNNVCLIKKIYIEDNALYVDTDKAIENVYLYGLNNLFKDEAFRLEKFANYTEEESAE